MKTLKQPIVKPLFYSDVHTKNKNNSNKNQNKNLNSALDFHKSDTESENFCQEIKNIQESIREREWDNTKLLEVSGQNQKNWHVA